jgi:UDP-N-acetylglucosamine diphosphorylase/glucosamine-1-phosphate N-acetyltransferase
MSQVVLFEDALWTQFLPLTYTRPVFNLRAGCATLGETLLSQWEDNAHQLSSTPIVEHWWVREELAAVSRLKSPALQVNHAVEGSVLYLNGRARWRCQPESILFPAGAWIGVMSSEPDVIVCINDDGHAGLKLTPQFLLTHNASHASLSKLPRVFLDEEVTLLQWPWELISQNAELISSQWESHYQEQRVSEGQLDRGVYLLNPDHISIGAGSRIKPCNVIDAESGPVIIDKDVIIQPHCMIQGPVYIGPRTLIQTGSVIHGGSSIGPRCKIGGEIEATIIQGYSNKQHDGFLGHSYIGEWVNIAADCINSDLKNTYGKIRVPINGTEVETHQMFAGLIMGDYSKAGINVSFPTGSVVGFSSSVVGSKIPKFVPSYTWMEDGDSTPFQMSKAMQIAEIVMQRREHLFTTAHAELFETVSEQALKIEQRD